MPPSTTAPPAQSVPSVIVQFADVVGGWPQVPFVAPVATLQMPPQQSAVVLHTSPACPQNEEAMHRPSKQSPEQHSALVVHALPSVLQVVLSGTHFPPEQSPLQQSALAVHDPWSEVHEGMLHALLVPEPVGVHEPEQHSPSVEHEAPRL